MILKNFDDKLHTLSLFLDVPRVVQIVSNQVLFIYYVRYTKLQIVNYYINVVRYDKLQIYYKNVVPYTKLHIYYKNLFTAS